MRFGRCFLIPSLHHVLGVIDGKRNVSRSAAALAGDADVPKDCPSVRCRVEWFGE